MIKRVSFLRRKDGMSRRNSSPTGPARMPRSCGRCRASAACASAGCRAGRRRRPPGTASARSGSTASRRRKAFATEPFRSCWSRTARNSCARPRPASSTSRRSSRRRQGARRTAWRSISAPASKARRSVTGGAGGIGREVGARLRRRRRARRRGRPRRRTQADAVVAEMEGGPHLAHRPRSAAGRRPHGAGRPASSTRSAASTCWCRPPPCWSAAPASSRSARRTGTSSTTSI